MSNTNTKRIAKNTIVLYFRQILILLVSLYTVRVVLNILGAEDYGVYNVVAGVVTMFSFLSTSMAMASQRYFSFDLGKNDKTKLSITFSVTLQIYIILIIILVLLAETIGLWFVNKKLVFPVERVVAVNWIYQFSIISFCFTLLTAPFMALIIAHENMNIYAYVSIVEASLKLLLVFILKFIVFDKLILYGFLMLIVSIINTTIYRSYCKRSYEECRMKHFLYDKSLFKEISAYSGWNLFGAFAGVAKNQIINIVLNIFFGPLINAARGIAAQVNSAVVSFANNFSTAMRPQVIKNYASKNFYEMQKLVYFGTKLTFFLMYIFSMPLILEMNYVLHLWLKNPPNEAILFTRLVLLEALIESLSYQIMTLAQATGKNKLYQGVVGGILLLNLPVSYLFLKFGSPAYMVLIISDVIAIIALFIRLLIVRILTDFSIKDFLCKVILPCLGVCVVSCIIPYLIMQHIKESFLRLCVTVLISIVTTIFFVVVIGLNVEEKQKIKELMKKIKRN